MRALCHEGSLHPGPTNPGPHSPCGTATDTRARERALHQESTDTVNLWTFLADLGRPVLTEARAAVRFGHIVGWTVYAGAVVYGTLGAIYVARRL